MNKLAALIIPVAIATYATDKFVTGMKSHIAREATNHVKQPDGSKLKVATSVCGKYAKNEHVKNLCETMFLKNYYAFMTNARKSSEPPQNVDAWDSVFSYAKSEAVRRGIIDDDDDDDLW